MEMSSFQSGSIRLSMSAKPEQRTALGESQVTCTTFEWNRCTATGVKEKPILRARMRKAPGRLEVADQMIRCWGVSQILA